MSYIIFHILSIGSSFMALNMQFGGFFKKKFQRKVVQTPAGNTTYIYYTLVFLLG